MAETLGTTIRRFRWDLIAVVVFFVIGALLGRSALQTQAQTGRAPKFYQNWLGAAVFDACGLGFTEVAVERRPPALDNFLTLKADTIACSDLPTTSLQPADPYADMHRYLAASLTLLWKIRGIRWTAITPLFELFSGMVGALIYTLFRLGMNRWWSIAGASAIAASGLNLFYLHKLRDYSKVPFLLASLLILGWLASRPASPRRLLALSCVFGGVIGIGLGFRTDIVIAVPLFLLTLACFLPAPRPRWGTRAAAVFLFVATVAATGWPVLRTYGGGSNSPHAAIMGFTEMFIDMLGLERTDYLVNQLYGDQPVEWAARNYELITVGGPAWGVTSSESYDRQARRYFLAVVRLLPADTVIHAYAAILRVTESAFDAPGQQDCETLRPSLAGSACHARNLVLGRVPTLVGPLAVAVLLVLALALNPRLGLFLTTVVLVFAGSTMLQFDPRHTFYLEFTSLWAVAFLAQRILVPWRAVREWHVPQPRTVLLRATAAIVVLFVLPALVLIAVRPWQQRNLTTQFTRYLAADVDQMPVVWPNPSVPMLPLEHVIPPLDPQALVLGEPTVRSGMLRADLGGTACAGHASYVALRYEVPFNGKLAQQAVVLQWSIPPDGSTVSVFMPIYRMLVAPPGGSAPTGELRLLDLEMMPAEMPCLRSLSTLRRPSDFPISLMAVLAPNWRDRPQYQTFSPKGAQNSPHPGEP
jgi:hypothetical protein